jgi:hypothetical protein
MSTPSITYWLRLEPLPRDGSMKLGLQAQVRDPLWFLARQYQLGEFMASDSGSAVQGTLAVESQAITAYQPGLNGSSSVVTFDNTVPLEAHVEREPVNLNLREAVQLGQYFEKLARAAGATDADIEMYRNAFPVSANNSKDIQDSAGRSFRSAVTGRAIDGMQLYTAIANAAALPNTSISLAAIATQWAQFCNALDTEPNHDSAWNARQLRFQFEISSDAGKGPTNLVADDFHGERLEWYSFDPATTPISSPTPTQTTYQTFNFLPTRATFRGMPNPRWWDLEDAQTDFGSFDVDQVDLAKMLVAEFGLVYGNDWFQLPLPLTVGTLSQVDALVITDTFGFRTLIPPADQGGASGQPAWSMFQIGNGQNRLNSLFVPPTLGFVQDGPILEEVSFLRDEMAEMAWGVEKRMIGPMDDGVDGYEAWRLRIQDEGPLQAPPTDTDIYYVFQTTVPDNWIPLVPIQAPDGGRYFRRGIINRPSPAGEIPIVARTAILDPTHPYFVNDHAVPECGTSVTRYFRRARWSTPTIAGLTVVWMARRIRPGRWPGWSGLAYDLIVPAGKTPAEITA